MKLPVELEHLIRTTASKPSQTPSQSPIQTPSQTPGLNASLNLIEARRNLEAEHYLRACALRLELPHEQGAGHHAGV
jgi:hypothetical protein